VSDNIKSPAAVLALLARLERVEGALKAIQRDDQKIYGWDIKKAALHVDGKFAAIARAALEQQA
jgi:hypothetical protein